jgi:endonuclease YncB( thermonuclease family)
MCMKAAMLASLGLVGLLTLAGTSGSCSDAAGAGAAGPDADIFTCTVASVTDGDTFRCSETDADGRQIRIRLSGVSAREADGSCSPGHPCPAVSAEAAAAQLRHLALGQRLACEANGTSYRRVAAFCRTADGTDLSCAMVESGTAERWDRYWNGHRC